MFADLTPLTWAALALLAVGSMLVGFSKTAVGGVGMISVAIFAAVLPSRVSTGVILPLLLVGDVVAVRAYRAHADWATLIRLIPAIAIGMVAGVAFIARVDDTVMRRAIGIVLVVLVLLSLLARRRAAGAGTGDGSTGDDADPPAVVQPRRRASWAFGTLTGFTTMVANAGGPAMSLYLLSARFSVLGFLGTTSWLFFVVNVIKVPFSAGLGLIHPTSLLLDLCLAPAVLLGAWVGRVAISRIEQVLFERLVLITTLLSGLNLVR